MLSENHAFPVGEFPRPVSNPGTDPHHAPFLPAVKGRMAPASREPTDSGNLPARNLHNAAEDDDWDRA